MAQFTFTNNTYAGEALAGFMASTLLEADSVKRGLLTVINDVKARKVILDVDDDVVLQNPSGLFLDQGTTALQNESYLDPVVYEFMKQEQWDKLIQSWEAQSLKLGAFMDYEGVVDLSDFMVQRYLTKIQIANERLYWLGKGSTKEAAFTAPFAGLLPTIAAASGVYKVGLGKPATSMAATAIDATGIVTVSDTSTLRDGDVVTITAVTGTSKDTTNGVTGVAIQGQSYFIQVAGATSFKLVRNYNEVNTRKPATFSGTATAATVSYINASNVLGVLTGIYAQLDPADRSQEDFNLQIPLHVGYAYAQAQADKAVNVLNAFTDPKKMDYLGVPLQLMNHWQANTILGARSSNLFLGVDLLGDASELSTVYMKPYTNDNVVRMKARMKAGNTILFGTVDPTGTKGVDGDFYINTSTYSLFGPKTTGTWGAGESLTGATGPAGAKGDKGDKGDTGATGPIGATGASGTSGINGTNGTNGAPGPGVAPGGTSGQVLSKIDATDYNTQWITPAAAAPAGILTARDDNSGTTGTPLIITNQGAKANNTGSKISFRAINGYAGADALREYACISAIQTSANSSVYSTIQFFTLTNNVFSSILNISSSNVNITNTLGVQAGLQVGGNADTVTGSGTVGLTGRNLVFGNRAGYNFDIGSSGAGSYKILMRIPDTNHISIGDENIDSSAVLTLNSTTNGFLPPRMSTVQRNAISSPTFGLTIANLTTKKLNFYNGTNWEEVSST